MLLEEAKGSKPQAMREQVAVSPLSTGSLAHMAWGGVRWNLPPKGMSTVDAPTVESNFSERPRLEQTFRSEAKAVIPEAKSAGTAGLSSLGAATLTWVCFSAPLVSRKERARSTITLPRHSMTNRGSAVTSATTVVSRFSLAASSQKRGVSAAATTTAILS